MDNKSKTQNVTYKYNENLLHGMAASFIGTIIEMQERMDYLLENNAMDPVENQSYMAFIGMEMGKDGHAFFLRTNGDITIMFYSDEVRVFVNGDKRMRLLLHFNPNKLATYGARELAEEIKWKCKERACDVLANMVGIARALARDCKDEAGNIERLQTY